LSHKLLRYNKNNMKNLFIYGGIIAALLLGGTALYVSKHIPVSFSATANPGANALWENSLAQPLGTADANMYVTSGADVQGNLLPLNSYQCMTVDIGQPNAEYICGTVTASATSGLTLSLSLRGLSTATATTSNSAFIFTHRRGADVRITDFPVLTILNNQLQGVQTIPTELQYANTVFIGSNDATTSIPTKYYVDQIAVSGAPNASTLVKGIVQLATAAQAALGTILGSTGANLVLPASMATSTPTFQGTNAIPVTGTNNKLSQLFLDFTQLFTFTGGVINTASSTNTATTTIVANSVTNRALVLNSIPYAFPSGLGASSTALMTDSIGKLSWNTIGSTTLGLVATSTTFSAPTSNPSNNGGTVLCVSPKVAINGGYSGIPGASGSTGNFAGNFVTANQPSGTNGWTVSVDCQSTSNSAVSCNGGTVTVYALCVNP
jgi:hypothetical protein